MATNTTDDRDKPSPDWKRPPEPPIHRAARHGDLEALQSLLDSGADINEKADLEFDNGPHLNGLTTLMVAARSIDGATTETLKWLVGHGADIHARSQGTNTAAWYAAGHGGRWEFHEKSVTPDHAERLRYLLGLGLDPNECNHVGRSLLTEACAAGDPARVRLLLERGVSVEPIGDGASRAATLARHSWKADDVEADGRDDTPRGMASSFQIPVFCASMSGSAECVELLLEAGADPNARDSSGETPLMVAGTAEVVHKLLQAGADLHATDEYGKDALEAVLEDGCGSGACGPERFDVARALIDAGAEIERVDDFGKARLASAAFGHHADTVAFLLKLGAKANALDSEGGTPLHAICWQGEYTDEDTNHACEQIIRSLVAAGVDVSARNRRDRTALHEAVEGDWGNQTATRVLLELGADADHGDSDGDTPLMLAAYGGEVECIRLLLDAGADPTRRNAEGKSASEIARDHVLTWERLVAEGPDIKRAEEQRRQNEQFARQFGVAPNEDQTDLSHLMSEEVDRHESALREAREALGLIERASSRTTEDADSA